MIETRTQIKSIFNGSCAYVYIWFSKKAQCIYVGQTNDTYGALGRASSHIRSSGTLRCRVYEKLGTYLERFDDWVLVSYSLPRKKQFISIESGFRLAVEYLVQIGLQERRDSCSPPFRIVSNVTYSDHCSNPMIKIIASEIIEEFISTYASRRL